MSKMPFTLPMVCQRSSPSTIRSWRLMCKGIEKSPRGRIEADAMLPLVAAALWLVPAKSHLYIQYCIYELWVVAKITTDKSATKSPKLCRESVGALLPNANRRVNAVADYGNYLKIATGEV
jgi:hypothetical protein